MARSPKKTYINRFVSGTTIFLVLTLISLVFARHAFADAGGWPTNTPTLTPTQTPTNTPPPTLTPIITATNLIGDTPQPPVSTPKAIPTGTLLSQAELLGTLEAQQPPANEGENARPAFWWYILILFGVSAAVVVVVLFGLLRSGRKQPPEEEPESEDNPPE